MASCSRRPGMARHGSHNGMAWRPIRPRAFFVCPEAETGLLESARREPGSAMVEPRDAELTFVLEDEGAETLSGSLRPEFEEIPPRLRSEVEAGLREQAFELLHAEAVARGELEAAPAASLGAPRSGLRLLLMLAVGAIGGAAAVAAATALLRWVTATLR